MHNSMHYQEDGIADIPRTLLESRIEGRNTTGTWPGCFSAIIKWTEGCITRMHTVLLSSSMHTRQGRTVTP